MVDPVTLDFGEATSGYAPDTKSLDATITSTGGRPLKSSRCTSTGPIRNRSAPPSPPVARPRSPPAKAAQSRSRFTPTGNASGALEAHLEVEFSFDTGAPPEIQLEGTALPAAYTVTPATKDFGVADVGTGITPRVAQSFGVTSTGAAYLPIDGASLSGPDASSFRIVENNCAPKIQPQEICGVKVVFDPKSGGEGLRSATLVVDAFRSGKPGTTSVPLTGTAHVPAANLSLKLKSAKKVKRGKTLVLKATVKNIGDATAKFDPAEDDRPEKFAKKPKAIKVSSLAAGTSVTKKIKIKVKKSAKKGKKLKVKVVASATGVAGKTATRSVKIK